MKTLLFTYDVEEILNGTEGETCMEITMADAAAKEILEGGYNRHVVEIIRHNECITDLLNEANRLLTEISQQIDKVIY